MTHIGLFEGIGGFSLAARWAGWQTPVMVEWNPYCQAVLKKNFPDAVIFGDIHEFDGRPYAGQFDILTGGFPCQPYSHAGKRAGNDDDRALWPQMLRVIREIKPAWIVGENVAGLLTMDGGRVLAGILADLEDAGYSPEIYSIPALAVGAPHERERIWIVAHCDNQQRHRTRGTWRRRNESSNKNCTTADAISRGCNGGPHDQRQRPENGDGFAPNCGCDTSDASEQRLPRGKQCGTSGEGTRPPRSTAQPHRNDAQWKQHWFEVATRLCRVDDGLSTGVDGTRDLPTTTVKKTKGKSHRLEALGNAIVPQVAFEIFKAINICYTETQP